MFNFFNRQANESNTQADTDCAWCLEEDGTLEASAQEGASHGICTDHSNQIRTQYHQRKFDRVPSYTTRYRDGQQTYWGEED